MGVNFQYRSVLKHDVNFFLTVGNQPLTTSPNQKNNPAPNNGARWSTSFCYEISRLDSNVLSPGHRATLPKTSIG